MAADSFVRSDRPAKTISELVAFTKKELDADAERARLQASSVGLLPPESQAGTTLDLSNAKIHALPVEVLVLIKDRVERLALSHNQQISIPSQIVQCDRLRYLNIRWNELTQFPRAILQLSNLEILDLSKNSITSLPEDVHRLSSLRFLAISNNKVTRLPLSIGDMTNLGRLKVDENPIVFPPPEVFRPAKDKLASRVDLQKSSDVCQNIKRFLKETASKEKQKLASEDDSSESNVETPRPPRRAATGGRFPIRPSISGIENAPNSSSDSPTDPPPIPQRSHARINSTTTRNIQATIRPSIAPLATDKNDVSRSRSETASSSASLRQRRQGFVPSRKVTGDLTLVPETSSQASTRSSQASTIKPQHARATSSISTVNSFNSYASSSNAGGSSGLTSPIEGPHVRFPSDELSKSQQSTKSPDSSDAVKSMKRLSFTLRQMERPIKEVVHTLKHSNPNRANIEEKLQSAQSVTRELDMLFRRLQNSLERGTTTQVEAMQAIVRISARALKCYGVVTAELKRNCLILVKASDGFVVRGLMFQIHSTTVEVRNVCSILGFKVRDKLSTRETPRISQAWSSKSITPTQPRAPMNARLRNPTPPQNANSPPSLRIGPPPPVPLNTTISRSNNTTSLSAATPRSGDSFQIHESRDTHRRPNVSRTNTMRSMIDVGENDEQFDRIFLKLKQACDLAAQALPHLRTEFIGRRDSAQSSGQRSHLHQWTTAMKKCEVVMANNKALKKRLELVKVNDPGVRYQRDFWQLCDAFVHSWTDLATVVKEIGGQRIDITTSKQIMRSVQRVVRDASKMISHSPLYHHAIGIKGLDSTGLAPLLPVASGVNGTAVNGTYPINTNTSTGNAQGNYVVGPATPLSAAIGPAAHSIQLPAGGEYVAAPHSSSRSAHERVDTVMQPPPRQQSRRPQ